MTTLAEEIVLAEQAYDCARIDEDAAWGRVHAAVVEANRTHARTVAAWRRLDKLRVRKANKEADG